MILMKTFTFEALILERKFTELIRKLKINWDCRYGQGKKIKIAIELCIYSMLL